MEGLAALHALDVRSKMRILGEHRFISVITLLYTGVVIYGFLGTKAFLKFRERIEYPVPAYANSFASFGLLLILLPVLWLVVLELLERREIDWTEGIAGLWTILGIYGTAFLGGFLAIKAVLAASVF